MQTTPLTILTALTASSLVTTMALGQSPSISSMTRSLDAHALSSDVGYEEDFDHDAFGGNGYWQASASASANDLNINLSQNSVANEAFPVSGTLSMDMDFDTSIGYYEELTARNAVVINFTVPAGTRGIVAWDINPTELEALTGNATTAQYTLTLERFSRWGGDPGEFYNLQSGELIDMYADPQAVVGSLPIPAGHSYRLTLELEFEGTSSWYTPYEKGAYELDFELYAYIDNDEADQALDLWSWNMPLHTEHASSNGLTGGIWNVSDLYKDVWFKYAAENDAIMTLSTCGLADFDTMIAIYEGTQTPVTSDRLVAWNDDSDGCEGNTSFLDFTPVCGKTYLIRVGGYGSDESFGSGRIHSPRCFNCDPCPAGNPSDLNGDGSVNGADMGAMLANFGGSGTGDLNNDGTVDGADLGLLFAAWSV